MNHPARQNHRIIPITINNTPWFPAILSPTSIIMSICMPSIPRHTPMKIERATFEKLLSFVDQFPHYFVGSNADLPHCGRLYFEPRPFPGRPLCLCYGEGPGGDGGPVHGLRGCAGGHRQVAHECAAAPLRRFGRLVELADKILKAWRGYTDESAFIFAETDGTPHNTITPIARRKGEDFELDLVLRNNITTAEHPLGVYHPPRQAAPISRKRTSASSRSWALRCCPPG